jgi:tetratricopeptide (TPR) repeat protein
VNPELRPDQIHEWASDLFASALSEPDPLKWLESAAGPPEAKTEAARLLLLHLGADAGFLENSAESARARWMREIAPGDIIASRYEILSRLGQGGMGEVFLVHDRELNQKAAFKTLRPHLAVNPAAVERFRREVLLLREINHPNVIRIYDFGRMGSSYFYTMEHLEGQTLYDRVKTSGVLSHAEALALARDLVHALNAVHANNIVHRDLKPSNIFLTSAGRTVLMDFGIALTSGQTHLTDTNTFIGSLDYMSPEQLEGGELTARSDYYSLGLVLAEAVTGAIASSVSQPGSNPMVRAAKRLSERAALPAIAGPLGRFISACLRPHPADRPNGTKLLLRLLDGHRPVPWRAIIRFAAAIVAVVLLWWFVPRPAPENRVLSSRLKLAAQFAARRSADDLDNARKEYLAAIAIDPRSAEAWTGLADVHSAIANFGFGDIRANLAEADTAARRALELDPNSGVAQAVQAYIVSLDLKRWRSADPLFSRAVQLDPAQVRVRLWYGAFLTKIGRFSDALAQIELGLDQDPGSMSLLQQKVGILHAMRDYPAAVAVSDTLVRLHPREPSAHLSSCTVHLAAGALDRAYLACSEARRLDNGPVAIGVFACVRAAQGQRGEARRLLQQAEPALKNASILVDLYVRIGEPERAMQVLLAAYAAGDSSIQYLGYSSRFDGLRQHPEFQRLSSQLGFAPAASR